MGALEIIVIIACVLIVAGVISKSVIDKKKGKNCCDGSCKYCKYASSCKTTNKTDKI